MRPATRNRACNIVFGEGNVKAADSLGMQTIYVRGDIFQTIAELDALLEQASVLEPLCKAFMI